MQLTQAYNIMDVDIKSIQSYSISVYMQVWLYTCVVVWAVPERIWRHAYAMGSLADWLVLLAHTTAWWTWVWDSLNKFIDYLRDTSSTSFVASFDQVYNNLFEIQRERA